MNVFPSCNFAVRTQIVYACVCVRQGCRWFSHPIHYDYERKYFLYFLFFNTKTMLRKSLTCWDVLGHLWVGTQQHLLSSWHSVWVTSMTKTQTTNALVWSGFILYLFTLCKGRNHIPPLSCHNPPPPPSAFYLDDHHHHRLPDYRISHRSSAIC